MWDHYSPDIVVCMLFVIIIKYNSRTITSTTKSGIKWSIKDALRFYQIRYISVPGGKHSEVLPDSLYLCTWW